MEPEGPHNENWDSTSTHTERRTRTHTTADWSNGNTQWEIHNRGVFLPLFYTRIKPNLGLSLDSLHAGAPLSLAQHWVVLSLTSILVRCKDVLEMHRRGLRIWWHLSDNQPIPDGVRQLDCQDFCKMDSCTSHVEKLLIWLVFGPVGIPTTVLWEK